MSEGPDAARAPRELRHWHPVLHERDLGTRPKSVMLHGIELVLFRTGRPDRPIAALGNICPHRRARLSDGWVEDGRVVCPYHGFRFAADGCGASDGTPRLRLDARAFEVKVAWRAIWVRARGPGDPDDVPLPALGRPGYRHFGTLVHDIDSPLEPLLDNFSEVEHTPTTHALFGYRRDALADLEVEVTSGDDWVRVENRGPQKPIPALVERMFGVRTGDTFIDDWTVRFSPVHVVYDQWWRDRTTGEPRADRLHLGVFFSPIDRDETRMVTVITSNRAPGRLDPIVTPIMMGIVDREVRLDRARVEALADKRPDLRGTRLGRFDGALRELRKRIDNLYR